MSVHAAERQARQLDRLLDQTLHVRTMNRQETTRALDFHPVETQPRLLRWPILVSEPSTSMSK